jgi:ribonuclease HII
MQKMSYGYVGKSFQVSSSKCPYEFDESVKRDGFKLIAGVDEAGRGPVAGPVVAAAVILPDSFKIKGIRDSKKVPEKEREYLFWHILSYALDIGVGIIDSDEIDRINILRATKQAMHNAVTDLTNKPDIILIDAVTIPSIKIYQVPIIKGDAKSASIAAASIVAKVVRDGIMMQYHSMYPQYEFDKHKGYATEAHLNKIEKYGPCPIHRKSFQAVMNLTLPF